MTSKTTTISARIPNEHLKRLQDHACIQVKGRVENWRSWLHCPISSSPSSNRTFSFPEYGFPIIFFLRLSQASYMEQSSKSEFQGEKVNFRDTIFNYASLRIHTRNYKRLKLNKRDGCIYYLISYLFN